MTVITTVAAMAGLSRSACNATGQVSQGAVLFLRKETSKEATMFASLFLACSHCQLHHTDGPDLSAWSSPQPLPHHSGGRILAPTEWHRILASATQCAGEKGRMSEQVVGGGGTHLGECVSMTCCDDGVDNRALIWPSKERVGETAEIAHGFH